MRRPILATLAFAVATLACVTAAAVSGAPVGLPVHPQRGDLVAYVVPRQVASCRLGDVTTGRVVGLSGDVVAMGAGKVRVGTALRSQLLVNGHAVSILPKTAAAFRPVTLGRDRVFVLGTGAARCDSSVVGSVPRTSVVGYAQATLDRQVNELRRQLADRITGEKYVAGVYLLVVAGFFVYLLIHAGRFARLERELAELTRERTAIEREPG